jgi:hypothetical protein
MLCIRVTDNVITEMWNCKFRQTFLYPNSAVFLILKAGMCNLLQVL